MDLTQDRHRWWACEHDNEPLGSVKCEEYLDSRSVHLETVSSYFCVAVLSNTTSVRFFSFIPHNIVTVTWKLCDDLWNLYASVVWMVDLTWRVACG